MPPVLLSGPAASGKNTIASALSAILPELAIVNVDVLRQQYVPDVAPWGAAEGRRRQQLGIRQACLVSDSFRDAGVPVLVLDVVDAVGLASYRLAYGSELTVVRVLPSLEVASERLHARAPSITDEEARLLYRWQLEWDADVTIDNSELAAEAVAERLLPLFGG